MLYRRRIVWITWIVLFGVVSYLCYRRATADPIDFAVEYHGHNAAVYALDYDSEKRWVASGGDDGLRVWRLDDLKDVFSRSGGRVHAVAFMSGNLLMCADANEGVVLLNTTNWSVQQRFGELCYRIVAAASSDGKWLAASFSVLPKNEDDKPSSLDIRVWRLDRQPVPEILLTGHEGPVFAIAFYPQKEQLVSRAEDGTVRLWDLETGTQLAQRGEPISRPWHKLAEARSDCRFDANGNRLLTGKAVSEFPDFQSFELLDTPSPAVHTGIFSPDGNWIATGHENGTVRIWDAHTRAKTGEFSAFVNGTAVYALQFTSDNKFLITAGKGTVPGFDALAQNLKADDTTIRIWTVEDLIGKGR